MPRRSRYHIVTLWRIAAMRNPGPLLPFGSTGLESDHLRAADPKISPMGTRIGFPGWVPYWDSAPLLFCVSFFHEGNLVGEARLMTREA